MRKLILFVVFTFISLQSTTIYAAFGNLYDSTDPINTTEPNSAAAPANNPSVSTPNSTPPQENKPGSNPMSGYVVEVPKVPNSNASVPSGVPSPSSMLPGVPVLP